MKIGKLDQHCGNCKVIELCGEPFSDICLCCKSELENIDEENYIKKVNDIRTKSKRSWSNKTLMKKVIASLNKIRR